MKKICQILFIIIAIATMCEFYFIAGMFTGPLAMLLLWIAGLVNAFLSGKDKNWNEVLLYLISTVGITLGYLKL
ncbi:MAG: hypothetical protein PHP50_10360 [Lachnospiraceae bacterium]|nr:hypothetical protein [Lachnospiraceae bacterium]